MNSFKDLLTEDIKRQKDVAQKALEKAKVLDDALKGGNTDPLLKDAKEALLEIARNLAANTTHTSENAVEVFRKSRDDNR